LRVYAKCIDGQDAQGRRLIEGALGTPDLPNANDEDEDEDEDNEAA
jgi:hypothetical protein